MKTFKDLLTELDACEEAVIWARGKTVEQAVQTCDRGDWLLWLARRVDIGIKPLTLAKGHCANTVRHLMKDERSIKAVDTAIAFGEGKATREELSAAADDADAVYIDDADAAYHADAAFYAVYHSDFDARYARAAAVDAATAAATAEADAEAKNQMETADICRKYIGDLIIEKVNEQLKG